MSALNPKVDERTKDMDQFLHSIRDRKQRLAGHVSSGGIDSWKISDASARIHLVVRETELVLYSTGHQATTRWTALRSRTVSGFHQGAALGQRIHVWRIDIVIDATGVSVPTKPKNVNNQVSENNWNCSFKIWTPRRTS